MRDEQDHEVIRSGANGDAYAVITVEAYDPKTGRHVKLPGTVRVPAEYVEGGAIFDLHIRGFALTPPKPLPAGTSWGAIE